MTCFLSPSPMTKKELKELKGKQVNCFNPTPFSCDQVMNGKVAIVGPDPFKVRKWYAEIEIQNGILVKVS